MTRGRLVAGWIALVRRRWRWGLGVGALVVGLAALLLFSTRPVYRAEARLRLGEAPPAPGLSPSSSVLGLFRMGGDPFANDLELLASRTLAEQVVESVALHAQLQAPRGWHRDSLFTAVSAGRATQRGTYELVWQPDGGIAVTRVAPTDSTVGVFAAGTPLRFAGVELHAGPRRAGAPAMVRVSVRPFGDVVISTGGRIEVERTSREANVIEIGFDDTDPRVAEQAVRAVVQGFIGLRGALFERESSETVDSLRVVAERTRAELAAAEAALVEQQASTGLVAAEVQTEAGVERMVDVQVQLENARQELEAIETMLARAAAAPEAASAWTTLVAHPRFFENETMGSMLTRLTELEGERAALAARRSETSLEYRTLIEQMRYLDGSLRAVASSYRTALVERIEMLDQTAGELRTQLAAVPAQAVDLARRQRDLRLLNEIFLLTEQRLRAEELRQALTFSNVQVIDEPALQYRPVWPRKKLGLAVALVLAMGFAVLAMVVVESADATVRSAAELSSLAGAPVLAALAVNGRVAVPPAPEAVALLSFGGGGSGSLPPLVVVPVDANGSGEAADAVRAVLAAGGWELPGRDVRVCPAVTSYAAARAALAQGGPVLLAVVRGRTSLPDVERAVRLLREAGGGAAGMVVVCRSEQEAGELWT
jgi:uncharacterized protein involved in exopolysaccharide biosynthesis